nr:hypothetical protein [Tanacetum cinerariifolium]
MSTRSFAINLFPPLDNPELTIRRRSRSNPTLLNNFEMAAEGPVDLPVPDLWTMEELCQPSLNGWGDDANKHLDKVLHVTQSIKVNVVPDDALQINKNLMRVLQVNQKVKAVTPNCETCGGPHSFSDCPATVGNTQNVYVTGAYQGSGTLPGITTRRGTVYPGPMIPTTTSSPVVERETEATKDTMHPTNKSTADIQPPVV